MYLPTATSMGSNLVFMPFQILGTLFRALFTIALLAAGVSLLVAWNHHRSIPGPVVAHDVEVPHDPDGTKGMVDGSDAQETHLASWYFGWNVTTAFLLGGVVLLLWSLIGW